MPNALKRTAVAAVWITATALTAWAAFAYVLPQDLMRSGPIYARLVQGAFLGQCLTFHIGIALLATGAAAAMLRRRRLVTLAGIVGFSLLVPTLYALRPRAAPTPTGRTCRVTSMNLKYTNRDADQFLGQVRRFNPDVLVLQDFTDFAEQTFASAFAGDDPARCLVPNFGQGLAIYSRLPFEQGPPQTLFTGGRRQMRAVIRLDGRLVAIYIVHPFSPRTAARILDNRRATAGLARQLRDEPLPAVVAGDFNFTVETPNQAAVEAVGLRDAFTLSGSGRGSTWPVTPPWLAWVPGVRIDHVFLSPELTCARFATGGYDGSDHLPIVADVGWASPGHR